MLKITDSSLVPTGYLKQDEPETIAIILYLSFCFTLADGKELGHWPYIYKGCEIILLAPDYCSV